MDVETFYDGYLAKIIVDEGNSAPVGSAIALLAETELRKIVGSGPQGRIVAKDVEAAAVAAKSAPAVVEVMERTLELGKTVAFTAMQGTVSRNMVESLSVPTFRVGYTITTDALDALYK